MKATQIVYEAEIKENKFPCSCGENEELHIHQTFLDPDTKEEIDWKYRVTCIKCKRLSHYDDKTEFYEHYEELAKLKEVDNEFYYLKNKTIKEVKTINGV